jgi:hypothetical protein
MALSLFFECLCLLYQICCSFAPLPNIFTKIYSAPLTFKNDYGRI